MKEAPPKVRVGVVGAGYWGIHHVRNFARLGALSAVCDADPQARARVAAQYPGVALHERLDAMLESVDAVVLATPAPGHAEQSLAALGADRHVLCEKPMALAVEDAERVARVAAASSRTFMVGHLMLYHPAVERLHELIRAGELGEIYYLYALRVNLGRLRRDENALWSLAPHDFSMILHLLGEAPSEVSARGECYLQPGVEDVVFVNLRFPDRKMAQVQLSWLDPRKERRLTVVGSRKMVDFDDVHPSEKLRIYDKGFDKPPTFSGFGEYLTLRQGDVHIPQVGMVEPLFAECAHFLECIRTGAPPRSGAQSGVEVVRALAAADRSLRGRSSPAA
jgi:predicted dehydrogenase